MSSLTPLLTIEDFFSQSWAILVGIFIGVVTVLLAEIIVNYLKKPKLIFDVVNVENNVGISVSVQRKTIKDARVRCNNISYPWFSISKEGTKIETEKKDLYVGDIPSVFFPYQASVEYVRNINTPQYNRYFLTKQPLNEPCEGIVITVKEKITQKQVYNVAYSIPEHLKYMTVFAKYTIEPVIKASVRIIGEGMEEEKDYSLSIGLNNMNVPMRDGKPAMDYISFGFELKSISKSPIKESRLTYFYDLRSESV